MTLGDRFLDAGCVTLDHDGEEVHSVVTIALDGRSTIAVRRVGYRRDRVQTLNLHVDSGELQVNGVHADSLCLRTDTAPDRVTLVATAAGPATLSVWNGWVANGIHHAWIGNAAMIHDIEGAEHALRCSDGIDAASFDDLVVSLRLGAP